MKGPVYRQPDSPDALLIKKLDSLVNRVCIAGNNYLRRAIIIG